MIIVAVSGGVDSIVLLDKILKNHESSNVIVAHVNHGTRNESKDDANFVASICKDYKVKYELAELDFKGEFSEEKGRVERYIFFEKLRQKYKAEYIVTAHHKDDVIETALINLTRGTGRRGLSSLKSSETIKRPLLGFYKEELLKYAEENKLDWREDNTNKDTKFLRNKIRLDTLPKLINQDPNFKERILEIIEDQKNLNREIDSIINRILERRWPKEVIDKEFTKSLDSKILSELVLAKSRDYFAEYYVSRERLESVSDFISTKNTGKQLELNGRLSIFIEKSVIALRSTV